jgi:hypothetical protein
MTVHDNMTKQLVEVLLDKWKINNDGTTKLSNEVYLTKSESSFPSPDGTFFDPNNNFSAALEFKPPTETKRGILTGLGQSIAYLDKHSLSYLAIPSKVEYFDMQNYMQRIFEKEIIDKMPIGLIIYDYREPKDILIYQEPNIEIAKTSLSINEISKGRYWAKWVDLPLHALWVILDISYNLGEVNGDRLRKVWDKFFLDYVYPKQFRNQFNPFNSSIMNMNGNFYKPMEKKLQKWNDAIINGTISQDTALEELKKSTDIDGTGDIYYWQIRKNFFPFIHHIKAWDEYGYLTDIGYEIHKIGKIHGPTSQLFYDYIAKILLTEGKHLDLILDIEKYTRNKSFENKDKAIEFVIENLIKKGLLSGNGNKKLSNEFQLWGHLNLVTKISNTYYSKNKGINFNWDRITSLLNN